MGGKHFLWQTVRKRKHYEGFGELKYYPIFAIGDTTGNPVLSIAVARTYISLVGFGTYAIVNQSPPYE